MAPTLSPRGGSALLPRGSTPPHPPPAPIGPSCPKVFCLNVLLSLIGRPSRVLVWGPFKEAGGPRASTSHRGPSSLLALLNHETLEPTTRLLGPPCRVSEVVSLSCEAVSALGRSSEQPVSSSCGVQTPRLQASERYLRWQQLERQALEEEEKTGGPLPWGRAPRLPSSAEEEAQAASEALLVAYGGPYGVFCGYASEEGPHEGTGACAPKQLGLALCDCALRGLHARTLQCVGRWCRDAPQAETFLPPVSHICPGPSRLLLTITGDAQTSNAAAERRLVALQEALLLPKPAAAAAAAAAAGDADARPAAAACLLEELRVSRLPLLLQPKAAEVWALRRQQLRCCMRLLLQQPLQQQRPRNAAEKATPAGPQRSRLTAAAAALQRECCELSRHLSRAGGAQLPLTESASGPGQQQQQQQLLLLLLQSELHLASWHLTARSHSYQAAEHAHRVFQLFLTELNAAPACTSSSSSSSGSLALKGEEPHEHQQAQQQQQQRQQRQQEQQQQVAGWKADLLATVEAEERLFWERLCQTTPSHFAGGQQLLRLLSRDLQRLLQQQLAAGLPLHARWLAACLQPRGAAAAAAAQTAEVGRRVLTFFPACDAAWRLCTYAFVALFDWTAAAAAATAAPAPPAAAAALQEEALQAAAVPPLAALVRAEEQWATEVTAGPLAQRHVDTLREELQLLQLQLAARQAKLLYPGLP
ncbi:hypothetical protein Esti_006110 [Eimeria stiedai]